MSKETFAALDLGSKFLRVLREKGYLTPTPIQAQAIPELIRGRDLEGVAQTGSGKTAAFALPVLQRLDAERMPARPKQPRALILAPTRELTIQIHDEFAALGRQTQLRYVTVIGGVNEKRQIRELAQGVDVLVATPGRLLDLASNRHVDLSAVQVLVLDEADRLLDMGFVRDVRRIVALTPKTRQSLLFSATMPKEVAALARELLRKPVHIDVSPEEVTVAAIDQRIVAVGNVDKQRALEHLLRDKSVSRAIVFTRTKYAAGRVAQKLERAGICAEAIHGSKSQNARQRALQSFKDGQAWVLVATDIAARGIDIDAVSHVINYELPHEPESYVHRIGRTGRAGAAGVAWSLVDPSERSRLRAVEKLIRFSPDEVVIELPPLNERERAAAADRERSREMTNRRSNGASGSSGGREEGPTRRQRRRRRRRAA